MDGLTPEKPRKTKILEDVQADLLAADSQARLR